jgi:hypothetical protein
VSDGEHHDNTLETDPVLSTQVTGERTPGRSQRRSSSKSSRRPVDSPLTQAEETLSANPPWEEQAQPAEAGATWLEEPDAGACGAQDGPRAEMPLTSEQTSAVRMAESLMSESERRTFERRAHARGGAHVVSPSTTADHDEGPSMAAKGKGVNPSNWGAFTDDPDMDVRCQREALAVFSGRGRPRHSNRNVRTRDRPPHEGTVLSERPSAPCKDSASDIRSKLERKQEELDQLKAELKNLRRHSPSRSQPVVMPRANTVRGGHSSWAELPGTLKRTTQLNARSFLGKALFGQAPHTSRRVEEYA